MTAHQAPPSPGFSSQEHWSGLPFPSPLHESEVVQSCPTLRNPVDCSLPGSSVHGICQARILECDAVAFSKSITYSSLKCPLRFNVHWPSQEAIFTVMVAKWFSDSSTLIFQNMHSWNHKVNPLITSWASQANFFNDLCLGCNYRYLIHSYLESKDIWWSHIARSMEHNQVNSQVA